MKLPILYKKTSTGAIQFWEIEWVASDFGPLAPGNIHTSYGQLGTENPQITTDVIREGKNYGKKNATTPLKQAKKEAEARWKKQKKKGYVEYLIDAEQGEIDDIIEGGISPMLAQSFHKHASKMRWPGYAQPKLDGIRCIAMIVDGVCTLWTRTRKRINSMPHIVMELEACFGDRDITFDGELYNHKFKSNFEHIVSLVRKNEPADDCMDVQYHIYDVISDETFDMRWNKLKNLLDLYEGGLFSIKVVQTLRIEEHQAMDYFHEVRHDGYEGIILRNADGMYVNRRSHDLLKVKEFDDGEFEIIGIEEGRGKLIDHVGAFVCRTGDGKEFLAKMSGSTDKLGDYFRDHTLWKGKQLTVQYCGLTGREGVPRFPVGIAIRDYE
jgi:ATP-dependent DNA ligase